MNSKYFTLFLEEANELWPEGQAALQSDASDWSTTFLRVAHTLKGMAGTMGYTAFSDVLHQVESLAKSGGEPETLQALWQSLGNALDIATATESENQIKNFSIASSPPETDPTSETATVKSVPSRESEAAPQTNRERSTAALRIDVQKLDTMFDAVGQLHTRLRVLGTVPHGSKAWEREMRNVQSLITRSVHHVANVRLSTLKPLSRLFESSLQDASSRTDKPVAFYATGTHMRIAREVVERLRPLIPHIARNALAHGIENAETRMQRGKPAEGQVEFSAHQHGSSVVVCIRDDGGGLSLANLRRKADSLGLPETLTDTQCLALVFESGFSTKAEADDMAGRGVGLDAVKDAIEAGGGYVTIRQEEGTFFELQMHIPVPLSLQNLVEIRLEDTSFGILDREWSEAEQPPPSANERRFVIDGLTLDGDTTIKNDSGYLNVPAWDRLGAVHVHRLAPPLNAIPNAIGFYLDHAGQPRLVYALT